MYTLKSTFYHSIPKVTRNILKINNIEFWDSQMHVDGVRLIKGV